MSCVVYNDGSLYNDAGDTYCDPEKATAAYCVETDRERHRLSVRVNYSASSFALYSMRAVASPTELIPFGYQASSSSAVRSTRLSVRINFSGNELRIYSMRAQASVLPSGKCG